MPSGAAAGLFGLAQLRLTDDVPGTPCDHSVAGAKPQRDSGGSSSSSCSSSSCSCSSDEDDDDDDDAFSSDEEEDDDDDGCSSDGANVTAPRLAVPRPLAAVTVDSAAVSPTTLPNSSWVRSDSYRFDVFDQVHGVWAIDQPLPLPKWSHKQKETLAVDKVSKLPSLCSKRCCEVVF